MRSAVAFLAVLALVATACGADETFKRRGRRSVRSPGPSPGGGLDDLVDGIEEELRQRLLLKLSSTPGDELSGKTLHELLVIYRNWTNRIVSARPRAVHKASGFDATVPTAHKSDVDALVEAIRRGEDLTPHLSRLVTNSYVPVASRKRNRYDLDLMLSTWGVHHFHLSTAPGSGAFHQRTRELMFAVVRSDDVYLIGIFDHNSWHDQDVLRILWQNWPTAGLVTGFAGQLSIQLTDADVERLTKAGVTTAVQVDANTFVLPAGQTVAGTPVAVTVWANQQISTLREFREWPAVNLEQCTKGASGTWIPLENNGWIGAYHDGADVFLPVVESPA